MRPAGLEPASFGAGNRRSAPLSYGRVNGRGQVTGDRGQQADEMRDRVAVPCPLSPVTFPVPPAGFEPAHSLAGVRQTGKTRFPTGSSTPFGASATRCL